MRICFAPASSGKSAFTNSMDELRDRVVALETSCEIDHRMLFGNGQPGKIAELEKADRDMAHRITSIRIDLIRVSTKIFIIMGIGSALLTAGIHVWVEKYLK